MRIMIPLAAFLVVTASSPAQPGRGGTPPETADEFIAKMMAFDKNKDGKLTRGEITDPRLLRLFDRADTNKDGVVTREELAALFQKETVGGGGFGGGPPAGRGAPPPRPGQVLPDFLSNRLNLTDEQKRQIAEVQSEVDSRLDRILSADQKTRLRDMRDRGPGRGGPP